MGRTVVKPGQFDTDCTHNRYDGVLRQYNQELVRGIKQNTGAPTASPLTPPPPRWPSAGAGAGDGVPQRQDEGQGRAVGGCQEVALPTEGTLGWPGREREHVEVDVK